MLAIFFPHMFEDLEYLVPQEDVAQGVQQASSTGQSSAPPTRMAAQKNAVAGPSRLR